MMGLLLRIPMAMERTPEDVVYLMAGPEYSGTHN